MTAPTPVRLSHLLRYCAPGALVRGAQDELLVAMDSRYWCDEHGAPLGRGIERVTRLRAALGLTQTLVSPPTASVDEHDNITGDPLPAVRFPAWTHCDSCGSLYYLAWSHQQNDHPRCTNPNCKDRRPLQQVPWILAHQLGYMDELPWHWIIHRQQKNQDCDDDTRMSFRLNQGLLRMECGACRARAEYQSSALLAESFFAHIDRMRRQPWVRDRVPPHELQAQPPVALEIGDARLFIPQTETGLVIPPESRMRPDPVGGALKNNSKGLQLLRDSRDRPAFFDSKLRGLAQELGCTPEAVEAALDNIEREDDLEQAPDIAPGQLSALEYLALTTAIPDLREDEDFVTQHLSGEWRAQQQQLGTDPPLQRILAAVDQVVAVQRLREVLVYTGFKREVGDGPAPAASLVPPDLDGAQRWLPAIELYGEGIFVTFSETMIGAWEQQPGVRNRADVVQRRALDAELPYPPPRFLLLHTLAHLMIRNLEIHSGYPAASLKERLYIHTPAQQESSQDTQAMAGILIYASVTDKSGTLGGLAEAAEPGRLLALLEAVFRQAEWCSLDPVCAEHEGQGPHLLNRAACHACALVPDTACEHGNVFLDRGFINGVAANQGQQAFRPLLDFAPFTACRQAAP